MKHLVLFLFLCLSLTARAQSSAWTLAQALPDVSGVTDVATDADGNVYLTGRFTGSLLLGTTQLNSTGLCLYIAKCRPTGEVLRVTRLEGTSTPYLFDVLPYGIAVDAEGNSYVTGEFRGTLSDHHGQEATSLVSYGGSNIFTLKCGKNGQVSWIRAAGGDTNSLYGYSAGVDIAVDQMGNSYITGQVNGDNLAVGSFAFPASKKQTFVASYSPQGVVRWAQVAVGKSPDISYGGGINAGGGIAVDNTGSCYVSGSFYAGMTIGGLPLYVQNLPGSSSQYALKLDARQGQPLWIKALPASGTGHGLATDKKGNLYLASNFTGSCTLGRTTLTSAGNTDALVACLNPQGGVEWATALGGPGADYARDLALDQQTGKMCVTGMLNLDPTTNASGQAFLAQLNPNGHGQPSVRVGGPGISVGTNLALDADDNTYLVGTYTGRCEFGPFTLDNHDPQPSFGDAYTQSYVARYGSKLPGHHPPHASVVLNIFPNPAQSQFTLQLPNRESGKAVRATLYNQLGLPVANRTLQPSAGGADMVFDTSTIPNGTYVLQLEYQQETTSHVVTIRH